MYDYQHFCYLDVQKTGSTFIGRLLEDCSTSPLLKSDKHAVVSDSLTWLWNDPFRRAGYKRDGVVYFNSVRDPFAYYASLFNYGCDQRGGLYDTLKANGFADLYDLEKSSVADWITFVMDPKHAAYLRSDFAEMGGQVGVGFLTYRFVRLSIFRPNRKMAAVRSPQELEALYERENICRFTIRNEFLNDDIRAHLLHHLSAYFDVPKVEEYLSGLRINASKSGVASADDLKNSSAADIIYERDKLIFDRFYRD